MECADWTGLIEELGTKSQHVYGSNSWQTDNGGQSWLRSIASINQRRRRRRRVNQPRAA